jgi:PPOX class probable F420-dependent enzyme
VDEPKARFQAARVARLATVTADGAPHIVPVVFARDGDVIWTAVDDKPKTTLALQRLANIAANPRVSLVADHYSEDWSQLWWVRADGTARVLPAGTREAWHGIAALVTKYQQYQGHPPSGPVIEVVVDRWREWSAR